MLPQLLLLLSLTPPAPARVTLNCQLKDDAEYNTRLHQASDAAAPCRLGADGQKYKILSGGKRFADYFSVADATLVTSQTVDRERLCHSARVCCNASQRVCGDRLKVTVSGAGGSLEIVTVHVGIEDRNDHAPTFPSRVYELAVPETSERFSEFRLPTAVDSDSTEFSIASYELRPAGEAFGLVQQHTAAGQVQARLRQLQQLDRERRSNYTFLLVASDRGRPSLSGTMTLSVRVQDANDHRPEFENSSYSGVVNETVRVGQRLFCVAASDRDAGSNARLSYQFSAVTERGVRHDFRLDPATGCLSVRSPLNFERRSHYDFGVVATDHGASPLSAEVPVSVRVLDVNDCDPKISVDFINDAVNESSGIVQKAVAMVSVQDEDGGSAGQVSCRVEAPADESPAKFHLRQLGADEKSWMLWLNGSVDREAAPYELAQVCCSDAGQPRRSDCARLRVKVLDVNDQPPVFGRHRPVVRLRENLPPGTAVAAVRATDADEDPFDRLAYSIDARSRRHFSVNARTGDIATAVTFDRELQQSFIIVVTATDSGGLSASTTVTVSVQDVNDERPRVVYPHDGDSFEFEVREDAAVGTAVGQLRAEDADSGAFGQVRYSLLPGRKAAAFDISADAGRIATKRPLDREQHQQYQLLVLLVDNPGGSERHSVTVSVRVRVLDINDNDPSIQFPTAQNTTFGVSYQEPAGQLILQVRAADRDSGDNGAVHFHLLPPPGADPTLFFIDPGDGKVKVNREMSEGDVGQYALTVVASDSGQPRRSSSASIVVAIDKSAPRQLLPDGRRGRRQRPASSLTVLLVAFACALVLLLLLLMLYVCHRRGLFGDAGLLDVCVGSDSGGGAGRSATAWKGGRQQQPDTNESLAFLSAQRTATVDRRDKPFPSVTSSLNQTADTAVSFEEQYVSCNPRRPVRRDGTQRQAAKAVCQEAGAGDYCTAGMQRSSSAAANGVGGYETAVGAWPPAHYDLELHSGPGGNLKAGRQHSSSIDNLAAVTRLLRREEASSPPRTGQLARRRPPDTGGCMYDLLEQGSAGHTLNHLGKLYSIPKASYV